MKKIKEWVGGRKKKHEEEYEETKKKFEEAIGKPSIHFTVEMPKGFEDMRTEFLQLEKDEKFQKRVENLVKRELRKEREKKKEK